MTESVDAPEAIDIRQMPLRGGGWIGYTDDAVFIADGDEHLKVTDNCVEQVALRTLAFDVAVMSLLLVAVGGWILLNRNPWVGVVFVGLGVASFYRTYRQRYELVIFIKNKRKPISVHPEHPSECYQTLLDRIRDA